MLTEAIREFGKEFPSLIRALVGERDEYMVRWGSAPWVTKWVGGWVDVDGLVPMSSHGVRSACGRGRGRACTCVVVRFEGVDVRWLAAVLSALLHPATPLLLPFSPPGRCTSCAS